MSANANNLKTKIMSRIKILLLILLSGFFSSCSKSKEEPNKIIGLWQKTKVERKATGGNWVDVTRDCDLDNIEEYKADGSYYFYPGSDWCGTSGDIMAGTWKLIAGESIIQYTYKAYSGTYESTITLLNDKSLVVTFATGTAAGDQSRDTYTRK